MLLVFAVALLFEGYTHGVLGESPQTANLAGSHGPGGPRRLVYGGPVINATGRHAYSYRMPAGTVALTFDDGPDPTWTPKILAILRREHVPATFFVVGAHAAANPSIVRAELAAGDVLPLFVDIFSEQHAARGGDRTVGDDLRVLAVDVDEKVVAVLDVLDERFFRHLAASDRDTPRMRLFDAAGLDVIMPLFPDRGNETVRRKTGLSFSIDQLRRSHAVTSMRARAIHPFFPWRSVAVKTKELSNSLTRKSRRPKAGPWKIARFGFA
jgi:hypothetical protein